MQDLIASEWPERNDRGAEERAQMAQRGPLQSPGRNADDDPRLEMRSRGG